MRCAPVCRWYLGCHEGGCSGCPGSQIHPTPTYLLWSHRFEDQLHQEHNGARLPVHLDQETADHCAAIFGCTNRTFPQNYPGLPLSDSKLSVAAFSSYVDKTDRFLSSWQSSLLNNMGIVLINSVLDAQLVYIMLATQVPQETLSQINRRRRSFLWVGNKDFSAGRCLVAWPTVCTTKELDGLGIWDFGTHNIYLLLNLIHRLHYAQASAWANWIREKANIENLKGRDLGNQWNYSEPFYRCIKLWRRLSLGTTPYHNPFLVWCLVRRWSSWKMISTPFLPLRQDKLHCTACHPLRSPGTLY